MISAAIASFWKTLPMSDFGGLYPLIKASFSFPKLKKYSNVYLVY